MSESNPFARANTVVSHYRILEPIGGGGMGVVYKALDLELNRTVALKFLSPDLAWQAEAGGDARDRFLQEARAASALDHPNIATVHAIDRTDDGQVFIAMAYYEGETLHARLARGRLAPPEGIAIFRQIAQGIAKAHEAGIVHRDIKPGNVVITRDGTVKVIDFGLAKLSDATRVTSPGTTLGTVAYMAPEQIRSEEVDARADVWSLGVVLFEILTGELPFPGSNPGAIAHAILMEPPRAALDNRDDVPPGVRHLVSRALDKAPERRYADAGELLADLTRAAAPDRRTEDAQTAPRRLWRAAAFVALAAVTVALVAGGWSWWRRTNERTWALTQAIPQLRQLVDRESYEEAFALATRVARIVPGEPALTALWPRIVVDTSIETTPPAADVSMKDYGDVAGEWRSVGRTPLKGMRIARGLKRWRIEAPGHVTLEAAAAPGRLVFALPGAGAVPDGMVPIPRGDATAWIAGMDPIERVALEPYQIDRYEVTNRQFKSFVDAGAYRRRDFWKHPFVRNGRELSWDEAMQEFRDATGRPGPATWELGTYPRGADENPVSGVSWYEATAYAEYAGKSLPSVYHWVRAASTRLPSFIVPLSNYSAKGTSRAGSHAGMSEFGVYDMAGNVREWLWNASGDRRHILGGAWNDPPYMFTFASVRPPFDRSDGNGFRCAAYEGGRMPDAAGKAVALSHRDYTRETPVSDEVFRVYLNQFSYDPTPLAARIEATSDTPDWTYQKVTFAAAYGNERVIAHLHVPKVGSPPYQTIAIFPGSNATTARTSDAAYQTAVEFLTRSGRAVVRPVYKGTYERNDGYTATWPSPTHRHSEYLIKQVKDFKRTIDYLETRSEFNMGKLAYYGISWGGRLAAIIPAVDRRVKLNLVELGGLAAGRSLPEVDQINYITRVTVPVLMINGRYDAIEPVDTAQLPMFRSWGTPTEHKRHVIFDTGHGPFPLNAFIKEVLDWLDRHFGPA